MPEQLPKGSYNRKTELEILLKNRRNGASVTYMLLETPPQKKGEDILPSIEEEKNSISERTYIHTLYRICGGIKFYFYPGIYSLKIGYYFSLRLFQSLLVLRDKKSS